MNCRNITPEERFDLIMECRNSGLTDHQWLLRSGNDGLPPIIYYRYSPTRSGDTAVEMTDGIVLGTYVMCDGYTGYNKFKNIRRCTYFTHIRRYLQEAIPKGHENDLTEPTVQGVKYCNKLFDYERCYDEQHPV